MYIVAFNLYKTGNNYRLKLINIYFQCEHHNTKLHPSTNLFFFFFEFHGNNSEWLVEVSVLIFWPWRGWLQIIPETDKKFEQWAVPNIYDFSWAICLGRSERESWRNILPNLDQSGILTFYTIARQVLAEVSALFNSPIGRDTMLSYRRNPTCWKILIWL